MTKIKTSVKYSRGLSNSSFDIEAFKKKISSESGNFDPKGRKVFIGIVGLIGLVFGGFLVTFALKITNYGSSGQCNVTTNETRINLETSGRLPPNNLGDIF